MGWSHHRAIWQPDPAPGPVVSLDALKLQTKVNGSDDDVSLASAGLAATQEEEMQVQRLLAARSCQLHLPCLPTGCTAIDLPGGKIQSLTNFTIDGVAQVVGDYIVLGDSPAQMFPKTVWPAVSGGGYPVTITYVAGYPATGSDLGINVPDALIELVKQTAAEYFEQREGVVIGATVMANPAVARLRRLLRIRPK